MIYKIVRRLGCGKTTFVLENRFKNGWYVISPNTFIIFNKNEENHNKNRYSTCEHLMEFCQNDNMENTLLEAGINTLFIDEAHQFFTDVSYRTPLSEFVKIIYNFKYIDVVFISATPLTFFNTYKDWNYEGFESSLLQNEKPIVKWIVCKCPDIPIDEKILVFSNNAKNRNRLKLFLRCYEK